MNRLNIEIDCKFISDKRNENNFFGAPSNDGKQLRDFSDNTLMSAVFIMPIRYFADLAKKNDKPAKEDDKKRELVEEKKQKLIPKLLQLEKQFEKLNKKMEGLND